MSLYQYGCLYVESDYRKCCLRPEELGEYIQF